MEGLVGAIILFVLLMIGVSSHQKAARNKRVAAAYKWTPKKAYASARFATNEDLRKAKLFGSGGLFGFGKLFGFGELFGSGWLFANWRGAAGAAFSASESPRTMALEFRMNFLRCIP